MTEKEIKKKIALALLDDNDSLDLIGLEIPNLSILIEFMKSFNELLLSECNITSIPYEFGTLKNVEILNLNNNNLSQIQDAISKMQNLVWLDLSENQITSIPDSIKELKNLDQLHLNNNYISVLPNALCELKNIRKINLNNNQLTSIPEDIKKLQSLEVLYLNSNQIKEIPNTIGRLRNLNVLDLKHNKIEIIPRFLLDHEMEIYWSSWGKLSGIFLEGNPLKEPPPEIVSLSKNAIEAWFNARDTSETRPLNEVKIHFVGDGGVGKTSLMKRILGYDFDDHERTTYGINIEDWVSTIKDEEFIAHLWDFGGQQMMHSTHHFLFSSRSLYIIVLDARRDSDPDYWLELIKSFSKKSPIIIALNKIDLNPGFELNRKSLMEKYPHIVGFYHISCKMGDNIEKLVSDIKEIIKAIEFANITWSVSWLNVKQKIERMRDTKTPYISYDDYKQICVLEDVIDGSSQETLLTYLNDLGIIVWFPDFELADVLFIDPRWVTTGIYRIITYPELMETNGRLDIKLLNKILFSKKDDYFQFPMHVHNFIIRLMCKFELCYEIHKDMMLVPDRLGIEQPEFPFEYNDAIHFVFDYNEYLPKSIIPRFIVRMHRDIRDQNLQWRTGVVIEDPDFQSRAAVKADYDARKLYVYVTGNSRRDYFAVILATIRDINQSFDKLNVSETVAVPGHPEATVGYQYLKQFEDAGIEELPINGLPGLYKVKELLGTVYVEDRSKEEILRLLRKLVKPQDTEETLMRKIRNAITIKTSPPFVEIDIGKIIPPLIKQVIEETQQSVVLDHKS